MSEPLCPHCGEKLELKPNNAYANFMAYRNANTVMTACCENFVRITAGIEYHWYHDKVYPRPFDGVTVDDWGNEKPV